MLASSHASTGGRSSLVARKGLTVRIGIGKWLQHLGVAALETLLISELFLVVDVAESAWNLEIEDKLAKQIEAFVG